MQYNNIENYAEGVIFSEEQELEEEERVLS